MRCSRNTLEAVETLQLLGKMNNAENVQNFCKICATESARLYAEYWKISEESFASSYNTVLVFNQKLTNSVSQGMIIQT